MFLISQSCQKFRNRWWQLTSLYALTESGGKLDRNGDSGRDLQYVCHRRGGSLLIINFRCIVTYPKGLMSRLINFFNVNTGEIYFLLRFIHTPHIHIVRLSRANPNKSMKAYFLLRYCKSLGICHLQNSGTWKLSINRPPWIYNNCCCLFSQNKAIAQKVLIALLQYNI